MLTARARRVAGRADALYAGQELPAFEARPRDAASWASPKAAVVVDGAFEHRARWLTGTSKGTPPPLCGYDGMPGVQRAVRQHPGARVGVDGRRGARRLGGLVWSGRRRLAALSIARGAAGMRWGPCAYVGFAPAAASWVERWGRECEPGKPGQVTPRRTRRARPVR